MKTQKHTLGKITLQRVIRADGSVHTYESKMIRIVGPSGRPTTTALKLPTAQALMSGYGLSFAELLTTIQDAAQFVLADKKRGVELPGSWSKAVLCRAEALLRDLKALQVENNAAWDGVQ